MTPIVMFIVGTVDLALVVVLLTLLVKANKRIHACYRENENQMRRHSEHCTKYSQRVEKRNEVIKLLLHEKYEPETRAFFIHMSDPSSHIPDSIFEKVDSYQEYIEVKKKKETACEK